MKVKPPGLMVRKLDSARYPRHATSATANYASHHFRTPADRTALLKVEGFYIGCIVHPFGELHGKNPQRLERAQNIPDLFLQRRIVDVLRDKVRYREVKEARRKGLGLTPRLCYERRNLVKRDWRDVQGVDRSSFFVESLHICSTTPISRMERALRMWPVIFMAFQSAFPP
jgi:hypothetical protein